MAFVSGQKEQVRQATHIVDLIGETVALKQKGREFVGLCPFHDDKNPSMFVSPAKQIYHCFSCGAGGDVFGYAMNYHKMTFPEAMKYLAERAGIVLQEEERTEAQQAAQTDRQMIADANERALSFYRAVLRHDQHGCVARKYIAGRGISDEMIESFQVGCAPDRWDGLATMIADKTWPVRGFELAGLVASRQQGDGFYDRLRHRLIFPILDTLGRPIAFGGRILPDGTLDDASDAKYLNSPETAVFNKSQTLYGIHRAKKPIIDSRVAVIVEGYTDVIACHQHGAANVVATLGTALTTEHVQALRRFADRVVLVFDADEAGQKAADRALELFLQGQVDVAIAVLPDGKDPDELLASSGGLEAWNTLVDNATDALTYQFGRVRQRLDAETTMTGRQRVAEDYIRTLAEMGFASGTSGRAGGGAIRRAMVIQRLSELLHLGEDDITRLLKRFSPQRPRAAVASRTEAPPVGTDNDTPIGWSNDNPHADVESPQAGHRMKAIQLAERQLIGALLREPDSFHQTLSDGRTLDEAVPPGELATPQAANLYQLIYDRLSEGAQLTLAALLCDLAEQELQELANLATRAEAEVERLAGGQAEQVRELARQAGESLLRFRNESEYTQLRRQLMDANAGADHEAGDVETDEAKMQALKRAVEHHRENPSSVRIARIAKST